MIDRIESIAVLDRPHHRFCRCLATGLDAVASDECSPHGAPDLEQTTVGRPPGLVGGRRLADCGWLVLGGSGHIDDEVRAARILSPVTPHDRLE